MRHAAAKPMNSVETVTILITDLVGSTGLESRIGPGAADELRGEHFSLLRAAIEESGGREVKNTGDGLMAAFESASAAVGCAVSMQQRLERRNRSAEEQLLIKVGISLGDATAADGDYFGMPVIEAARLCDRASGGQILVKEIVAHLAGGRAGDAFKPVGALELKGLPEPLATVEVAWEPLGAEAGFPSRAASPSRGAAGRLRRAARASASAFERCSRRPARAASASRSSPASPGSERPGSATLAALEARAQGATVLYGRSDQDLGVPYGPWVEALSHYVEHAPEQVLRAHVERHGGELARLVPALRERLPDVPAPRETDPDTERYLLWGAVAGLLAEASREQPIVLVLDDLHWADKPTLLLLEHVVAHGAEAHALLIAHLPRVRARPRAPALARARRPSPRAGGRADRAQGPRGARHRPDHGAGRRPRARRGRLGARARALQRDRRQPVLHRRDPAPPARVGRDLPARRRALDGARLALRARATPERARGGGAARRAARRGGAKGASGGGGDRARVRHGASPPPDGALRGGAARPARGGGRGLGPDRVGEGRGALFVRARAHNPHPLRGPWHDAPRPPSPPVAEALEELCGADPGARVVRARLPLGQGHRPPSTCPKAIAYARLAGERALSELAPDEALRWFTQALELLEPGGRGARRRALRAADRARRGAAPGGRGRLPRDAARGSRDRTRAGRRRPADARRTGEHPRLHVGDGSRRR